MTFVYVCIRLGRFVKDKVLEIFLINSAHSSVHRGWFVPSIVFVFQLEDTAHKLKFRLFLIIAVVPLFLNTSFFYYRLNLSEEQTLDIEMIEQLREAVDLLQDPNRYAHSSLYVNVMYLKFL